MRTIGIYTRDGRPAPSIPEIYSRVSQNKCLSEFSRMTGQRWVKLLFRYSRLLDEKNNDLTGS